MKKRNLYLYSLLILILAGCATTDNTTETLVLSNVLDEKALKAQTQLVSGEQQQSMYAPLNGAVADLSQEEVRPEEVVEIPTHPFTNIIPSQFTLIDTDDEYYVLIMKNMKAIMPGVEYVFMDRENFLTVAVGQVPLKRNYMERLSEAQLKSEVEKLAQQHQSFYKRFYNTDLNYQIREKPFLKLSMKADYMHQATLQSDIRATYFSDLSRRNLLLITGPKQKIREQGAMIDGIIEAYESSLLAPVDAPETNNVSEKIIQTLNPAVDSTV